MICDYLLPDLQTIYCLVFMLFFSPLIFNVFTDIGEFDPTTLLFCIHCARNKTQGLAPARPEPTHETITRQ